MFFAHENMFAPTVNIGKMVGPMVEIQSKKKSGVKKFFSSIFGSKDEWPQYCAEISFVPEMNDYPVGTDAIVKKIIENNEFQEEATLVEEEKIPENQNDFYEVPDDQPVSNMDGVVDNDDLTGYMLGTVKSEYVFLLDRSGSMHGNRIKRALEALKYFLKS